ncbi:hypothetical protein VNO77_12257 [Canavalia gladiata]|uniref:Uncharacterized protein n=1 Tax=Canavalia gladiata TaxID=3824 RepID=A0AAN9LWI1_CANGL
MAFLEISFFTHGILNSRGVVEDSTDTLLQVMGSNSLGCLVAPIRFLSLGSVHRYQLHKAGELSLLSAATFPLQLNPIPPLFS